MIKITQESSLKCKEIECNRIDDDDDEYDKIIVYISNQVIIKMRNDDEMDDKKVNWKWKRKRKFKQLWTGILQKYLV